MVDEQLGDLIGILDEKQVDGDAPAAGVAWRCRTSIGDAPAFRAEVKADVGALSRTGLCRTGDCDLFTLVAISPWRHRCASTAAVNRRVRQQRRSPRRQSPERRLLLCGD